MKRLMIIALLLAFLELPALAEMTLYTTYDVNLREGPGQKYAKMDRAGRRAPLRPAAVRASGHRRALNERGFARGKAFHGICIIDIAYLLSTLSLCVLAYGRLSCDNNFEPRRMNYGNRCEN